ncbi:protein OBERON 1 isoform X2 [Senna tora]|uniref:Protein OBERON 1 isoform X2 n=1 Tax=Senna tora TaxID=362788 RepID=A0A835CBL6_9FABA|nr:protein OBERON 1 isoform X2 [Senna tora]
METEGEDNDAVNNGALILRPVAPEESGQGLPYAPENWPNPGDVWGWRTGKRVAITGHFRDRYLYLPVHLCRSDIPGSTSKRRRTFASKPSLQRYIQEYFPDTDFNAFFASFSWKIPAIDSATKKDPKAVVLLQDMAVAEEVASDRQSDTVGCKAGNQKCDSLIIEEKQHSPSLSCDVFCTKPGFCHDCCCILCHKTVDSSSTYGGCSYIKCQEKVGEFICGHIAHINCALRCFLAGTVGGSIGLDVEYHCRHCDGRTDLISHANELLQKCETINSRDDIEKILNLGACVLRGSQKIVAKRLLSRIELALSKV